ncbi:SixA phosphatase family protein [Thalassococcus sp. BH17M4-6]|uniref:SixA phosphatase family protein n=1 Tax=Thalassococcus sp. BH17M4-6 TaxID=3413148 RepID=UPI003BE9E3FB
MRLILMRHAKSDWSMIGDDHDRTLNARGRKSARALGDWMRDNDYLPDQVLCSSAARTRETLALTGVEAATNFEDALYHAAPDTMLTSLRAARGDCVLMVGHNPGIAFFAAALVKSAPDHPRFQDYPTCATLVADFDITNWADLTPGTGNARDFVIPRELIGS